MNEYEICYSSWEIIDGKITKDSLHFSNCKATINGDTYEDAVKNFRKERYEKGYYTDFIIEGNSIANITFYNKIYQ